MTLHRHLLAPLLAAALIAASLAAATAAPAQMTAEQGVAELNQWRTMMGLQPVGHDLARSEGCRLHNGYLAINGFGPDGAAHYESPGLPGYTPEGALAGATSDLAWGEGGPLQKWEQAIYHRLTLLQPRARVGWFDASSGFSCMGVQSDPQTPGPAEPTFYTWPVDGQRDVAAYGQRRGGEWPDPYDALPPETQSIGNFISLLIDGPWPYLDARVEVDHASLVPDGGAPVPVAVWDSDGNFGWSVTITPLSPLAMGRWYTVTVSGSYGLLNAPYTHTWRYRTQRPYPAFSAGYDAKEQLVRVKSDNTTTPVHIRVTRRNGPVMLDTMVDPVSDTPLPLTPGQYFLCAEQAASDDFIATEPCGEEGEPDISILTDERARVTDTRLSRRRVSFAVTAPHVSVGRRLGVSVEGWVTRCPKPRECRSSWRTLNRSQPKLTSPRQRVVLRFTTARPLPKARVRLFVPGDEDADLPYAGEDLRFVIRPS